MSWDPSPSASTSGEVAEVADAEGASALVRSHDFAMCKIPAGEGFGGRKSRVTIGWKLCAGRKVVRRWETGVLVNVNAVWSRILSVSYTPGSNRERVGRRRINV
jgi:hypothetical protein